MVALPTSKVIPWVIILPSVNSLSYKGTAPLAMRMFLIWNVLLSSGPRAKNFTFAGFSERLGIFATRLASIYTFIARLLNYCQLVRLYQKSYDHAFLLFTGNVPCQ